MARLKKVDGPTDWESWIVAVKKKDGSPRICTDPEPLNKALQEVDAIIWLRRHPTQIGACHVIDKSWYWERILANWKRRGIKSANNLWHDIWSIQINKSLRLWSKGIQSKFKEVPIANPSNSRGSGMYSWRYSDTCKRWKRTQYESRTKLLEWCEPKGIKSSRQKINLCLKSGHMLTKDGLKPYTEMIKAIQNMPRSSDAKIVLSFADMTSYLKGVLPNSTDVLLPLQCL